MRASQKDGYKKLDLWVATVVRGSVPEKRKTELLIKIVTGKFSTLNQKPGLESYEH